MNPTLRPVNPDTREDIEDLVRWANDPAIRHLYQVFRDEQSCRIRITAEMIRTSCRNLPPSKQRLIIEAEGGAIGEAGLELDPPRLRRRVSGSAMFYIVIGEAAWRDRGIGQQVMLQLEQLARAAGALRAEIGVFEFNEPAIRLYRKLGYREFSRTADLTWWQGRRWGEICMEKTLNDAE